jgi:hypothetical protein
MKFQCECGKTFIHPSVITEHTSKNVRFQADKADVLSGAVIVDWMEEKLTVCPFCKSQVITEFVEPTLTPEEIANVYIYDLTSGVQTKLDELLAQGYRIQSRYAKQYFLEKPKPTEVKQA